MRKTFFLFFLASVFAILTEVKAQEPVSQSERRTVIKAIETKIAELEVKRAVELSKFYPVEIDGQLVNLRKRLAELTVRRRLTSKRRSLITRNSGKNNLIARNKKLLQLTDSPPFYLP